MQQNTSVEDVVAILDQSGNQILTGLTIMKAKIVRTAKLMEHPLETGATITDHRILQPIEIELPVLASGDFANTYAELSDYFVNGDLIFIQTAVGTYNNMVISEMPHEETAEVQGAIAIGVKLKEARFVTAAFGKIPKQKAKSKKHASTTKTGKKDGKESATEAPKESALSRATGGRGEVANRKKQ